MRSDAMSKMNELAAKSNTLTKDLAVRVFCCYIVHFVPKWVICLTLGRRCSPTNSCNFQPNTPIHPFMTQGTFVTGAAMEGKVKVTFTGTQVGGCVGTWARWCLRASVSALHGSYSLHTLTRARIPHHPNTQVPMEVEVSEEALGAGAAALSAALTEAMKEGHAKSVQLQQTKLTCVLFSFFSSYRRP